MAEYNLKRIDLCVPQYDTDATSRLMTPIPQARGFRPEIPCIAILLFLDTPILDSWSAISKSTKSLAVAFQLRDNR